MQDHTLSLHEFENFKKMFFYEKYMPDLPLMPVEKPAG